MNLLVAKNHLKVSIGILLVLALAFASFNPLAKAQHNDGHGNGNGIGQTVSTMAKDKDYTAGRQFGKTVSEMAQSESEVFLGIPESVGFDLTKLEKQEFTYIDENGDIATYGAEPVVADENEGAFSIFGTYPISNGISTWKIYHYSGAINMSYRIKINRSSSSTVITDAYDLSVTLIGYSESDRYFGFTSSNAEYSATATLAKILPFSFTIWLKASVDGDTLTTRAKS